MNARMRLSLLLAGSLLTLTARGGTETSLWHAYTPPSGEPHHAFMLSCYKRGIFFGSCGPSTRSLQWRYTFDLKGTGPRFTPDRIELKTEEGIAAFPAVTGEVLVDDKKKTARITLKILQAGMTNDFIGNGIYTLREKL
jgi:hypothetical protein